MKRIYKNIIATIALVVLSLGMISCGTNTDIEKKDSNNTKSEVTEYPLMIEDTNGNEVVIESEPKTVVSLGPNVTEMIYALGKGDVLVGRTKYCDYPEDALSVQEVGDLMNPNLELIAEINPDLVVSSTHFDEEVTKRLDELGIKSIIVYSEESFEGVYDNIEILGEILNVTPKAEEVVKEMKAKVTEVTEKVKGLESPSVYYMVDFGQYDSTAGGDTFIGKMIDMAGGKNIADDSKGWGYSKEAIAEKNPDMIILSKNYDTKTMFMAADFYKELNAVKSKNVYELDDNKVVRQGPRLAEGLEDLAKIIHPEAFK